MCCRPSWQPFASLVNIKPVASDGQLQGWSLIAYHSNNMSLQVLRSSGIDAIVNPGTDANPETDIGAVHDALEALAAITSASEEGHLVCLQSGAIGAAASALQVVHATVVAHVIAALCMLAMQRSSCMVLQLLRTSGKELACCRTEWHTLSWRRCQLRSSLHCCMGRHASSCYLVHPSFPVVCWDNHLLIFAAS